MTTKAALSPEEWKVVLEGPHTRYHSVEELRENGFAHLRNAVAVLESKATTEELQTLASAEIHPPRGEASWKADAKLV